MSKINVSLILISLMIVIDCMSIQSKFDLLYQFTLYSFPKSTHKLHGDL